MRTTVDLPEKIYRKAKSEAALKGITLRVYILEALKLAFTSATEFDDKGVRVSLPLVPSSHPGALKIDGKRDRI